MGGLIVAREITTMSLWSRQQGMAERDQTHCMTVPLRRKLGATLLASLFSSLKMATNLHYLRSVYACRNAGDHLGINGQCMRVYASARGG